MRKTFSSESCIFCKIVTGDIPCLKLYENNRVLSFMDIAPFNDGHCLVITKAHSPDLFSTNPEDLSTIAKTTLLIASAVKLALDPPGLNVLQANGPAAGQTVFHYHCHILPRMHNDNRTLNWEHTPGDSAKIQKTYELILSKIQTDTIA